MRIAFLTNILTPYRVYFFDELYNELGKNIRVFVMTEDLPLRPWNYTSLRRDYTQLLKSIKLFYHGDDYLFSYDAIKEIASFSPDILIVAGSWTYPTTWEIMLSRRITKKAKTLFWTESHEHTGVNNSTKTKQAIRNLKKYLMGRFDGFCLPGKYALEALSNLVDIKHKDIICLPNLINDQYYDEANKMREDRLYLRNKKSLSDDSFVFFTPASMRKLKGQLPFFDNVVDAVRNKKVVFILAGEGPDKNEIEKMGKINNLDIRIYDYQDQSQIREWLALSDAFLLPSLSDANPLSNIEAAWAGLPLCVSCYVGNGPELVEDGVNGVIFDTLDKKSVCEKIGFILRQNKSWLKEAGCISHEKAKEGFEAKSESLKFIDRIAELI